MKKIILFTSLTSLLLGIFIFGYFNQNNDFPDQKVYDFIHEGFTNNEKTLLLHKEKVDEGMVLFYGNLSTPTYLGARFVKKRLFDWVATMDQGEIAWNYEGPKEYYQGPHTYYFPLTKSKSVSFPFNHGVYR